jgi:hypothetical protein
VSSCQCVGPCHSTGSSSQVKFLCERCLRIQQTGSSGLSLFLGREGGVGWKKKYAVFLIFITASSLVIPCLKQGHVCVLEGRES